MAAHFHGNDIDGLIFTTRISRATVKDGRSKIQWTSILNYIVWNKWINKKINIVVTVDMNNNNNNASRLSQSSGHNTLRKKWPWIKRMRTDTSEKILWCRTSDSGGGNHPIVQKCILVPSAWGGCQKLLRSEPLTDARSYLYMVECRKLVNRMGIRGHHSYCFQISDINQ